MQKILLASLLCCAGVLSAQAPYFPPATGNVWATTAPASLGWCTEYVDTLYNYLEQNNTKAFILLKDGKIVFEKYFGTFSQDSLWYWASAGKTLTAFMVGLAQQEGYLALSDTTSSYLGQGWTSCTPAQEAKITVWNQLTMTSGLDDKASDPYCTLSSCLKFKADAGTRWAYHNGPYTLLDQVIEAATGKTLNNYVTEKLRTSTGINGVFLPSGYNNVFFSKARSMARFGLLLLNKGEWNGTPILTDTAYFNQMIHPSQTLNNSYGYLTWLNGQQSYMVPGLQFVFPGNLIPNAPADMYSAMGKNGQFVNVVPSQNLVWIRMGNAPDGSEVPFALNDSIWKRLNLVVCNTSSTFDAVPQQKLVNIYPNPVVNGHLTVELEEENPFDIFIYDVRGQLVFFQQDVVQKSSLQLPEQETGLNFLTVKRDGKILAVKHFLRL